MTDNDLRDIVHHATHEALPPASFFEGQQSRARIQVAIADFVIGAIRASEHGADSFGDLYFHDAPVRSQDTAIFVNPSVDAVRDGCIGTMTAERATYFLERFKREEKWLGPHEQWALDYTIAALNMPGEAIVPPENGERDPEWRAIRRAIDQFAGRIPTISKHRAVHNAHLAAVVKRLDAAGDREAADTIVWQCWFRALDRERERFLLADALTQQESRNAE